MQTSQHIIRKQTIDFQYNGNTDGFALQKEVSDWCKFMLIPEIEQQLESFDFGTNYITIDKLEIDAAIDKKDWQQRIRNELISSLKLKLRDYKPAGSKLSNEQQNEQRSFKLDELVLFYFKKGYLPWWSSAFVTNDFVAILVNWATEAKSQSRIDEITVQLNKINSRTVVQRILNHLHGSLFFTWAKQIFNRQTEVVGEAEAFLNAVLKARKPAAKAKSLSAIYCEGLLSELMGNEGRIDFDLFVKIFRARIEREITGGADVVKSISATMAPAHNLVVKAWRKVSGEELKNNMGKNRAATIAEAKRQYQHAMDLLTKKEITSKNRKETADDLLEGIYIDNGGAVLVAAFLPTLFQRLNIAENNAIMKPDLAVLMIHYIVTGKVKAEEHELLLPKILCGISPELVVNTNKRISTAQKYEANEMLRSVIEHWAVIKNTSVEGLRESFLQRSAKLILSDNEWLLQVEQKSYDMLLMQLPWNISMIRLPWMQQLLKTEWV